MASQWVGSIVFLRWLPDTGLWKVTQRDPIRRGWVEITPKDSLAQMLANMSPCGKLWVRTRDITRHLPAQEYLS